MFYAAKSKRSKIDQNQNPKLLCQGKRSGAMRKSTKLLLWHTRI